MTGGLIEGPPKATEWGAGGGGMAVHSVGFVYDYYLLPLSSDGENQSLARGLLFPARLRRFLATICTVRYPTLTTQVEAVTKNLWTRRSR